MCTVVVRWSGRPPTRILALRDELTNRAFDDPGRWWPEQPDVVAGRDRAAGGTWCASRVGTGATALVLNRPQKRQADPGAPSRGVLPLLCVRHESEWTEHIDLAGMASFALVLATPAALTIWSYDGGELTSAGLDAGIHMVTSGGAEDGKADRYLGAFASTAYPDGWRAVLQRETPQADPAALVVRLERNDVVYATVFGQLLEAAPGRLSLDYTRRPWTSDPWQSIAIG